MCVSGGGGRGGVGGVGGAVCARVWAHNEQQSAKLYLYHRLSHFPSHGHRLGFQKQMFRENLRCKMFLRNQPLWREGKEGRPGQGGAKLWGRPGKAPVRQQRVWGTHSPVRWSPRAEAAGPSFTHPACLPGCGHPRKGITSKEATLPLSRPWRSTAPSAGT